MCQDFVLFVWIFKWALWLWDCQESLRETTIPRDTGYFSYYPVSQQCFLYQSLCLYKSCSALTVSCKDFALFYLFFLHCWNAYIKLFQRKVHVATNLLLHIIWSDAVNVCAHTYVYAYAFLWWLLIWCSYTYWFILWACRNNSLYI